MFNGPVRRSLAKERVRGVVRAPRCAASEFAAEALWVNCPPLVVVSLTCEGPADGDERESAA